MKTLGEQIANRCVHFNGVQHMTCKAGVEYELLRGTLPCLKDRGNHIYCGSRRWPTADEISAEIMVDTVYIERMKQALPIIIQVKQEHRKEDWQGTTDCPVCGGVLHLRIAAINDHVWGQCETADCLNWME